MMAFVTYIIIAGFYYGLQEEFTSEKLSYLYGKLIFYWLFESLVQKGFFMC